MNSVDDTHCWVGFPIRKFTDQSLLAAPRDLSQRATSFIASQCQGIHQTPFICLISTQCSSRISRAQRTNPGGETAKRTKPYKTRITPTTDVEALNLAAIEAQGRRWRFHIIGHFRPISSRCQIFRSAPTPWNDPGLQSLAKQRIPCRNTSRQIFSRRKIGPGSLPIIHPAKFMVEADGIEPTTSCLQSTRSPN